MPRSIAGTRCGVTDMYLRPAAVPDLPLLRLPGVYRAQADTWLLADVLRRGAFAAGRTVLDVCTGSGALAVSAHRAGARSVTAVDLSRRSVLSARLNSWTHRAAVAVHRGNLFVPVTGRRFELVLANPPYVPAATDVLPRHRAGRCWDAGTDGRAVLDRLCAAVAGMLEPGGHVLMVQSVLSGVDATLAALAARDLEPRVHARARVPFGPVLRGRARLLRERALIAPGQAEEEIVVIGGRRG